MSARSSTKSQPRAFTQSRSTVRHPQRRRGFRFAETTEEAALDDLAQSLVQRREPFQRLIERHQKLAALGHGRVLGQRNALQAAAPTQRAIAAGVIHQDPAHRPGGNRQKVGPVFPLDLRLIHEPEIRLVHQTGRAERVTWSLGPELTMCHQPQLRIHQRQQLIHRLGIAVPQLDEKVSDRLAIVAGGPLRALHKNRRWPGVKKILG